MSATDEKEHDEYIALLEQENAKLLAALEDMLFCFADDHEHTAVVLSARAAIAQAIEQEREQGK
jgi:hypothetical protein